MHVAAPVKRLFLFTKHLSIYLAYISPTLGTQNNTFRDQGDIALPSPSVSCRVILENIEEGLPVPLTPSLLVAFYDPQGTQR